MPKVSIALPTYNRADTIVRAIKSVQAQTFQDWELIVVDDGSTDGTSELIAGMDSRMVLIRQENRGFTEARNAAIRAGTGDYFAFIDSDDEFMPHHLELCVAFLETFKDESFVSTELLEDFGGGVVVNHYRTETSDWYPKKAALVGSHALDLPPGETDDYLRIYESKEPIGAWGRHVIERLAPAQEAFLYRGEIFDFLRYDFLITITATVMRSSVFEEVGLPEPRWLTGSDFHYLARLCRKYRANFMGIPTFIKHEFNADGELPAFGHVVTGKSALRFASEWQAAWDDLFWNSRSHDAELRGLRSLRLFWTATAALRVGLRKDTLDNLKQVREGLPKFWEGNALYWAVRCLPGVRLPQRAYAGVSRVRRIYERARRVLRA